MFILVEIPDADVLTKVDVVKFVEDKGGRIVDIKDEDPHSYPVIYFP